MKVSLSVSHSGQLATDMSTALDLVDQVTLLKKLEWHGIGVRASRIIYDKKFKLRRK